MGDPDTKNELTSDELAKLTDLKKRIPADNQHDLTNAQTAYDLLNKFNDEEQEKENYKFMMDLEKIRSQVIKKISHDPNAVFLQNDKTSTTTKPLLDQDVIFNSIQGRLRIKFLSTEDDRVEIAWDPKFQGQENREHLKAEIRRGGFFRISKETVDFETQTPKLEINILTNKEEETNLSPYIANTIQELKQVVNFYLIKDDHLPQTA